MEDMKRDGLLPTVTVYYMRICSQRMLHLSDAGARPTRLAYTYMNDFLCWSWSGHLKSIVIIIRIVRLSCVGIGWNMCIRNYARIYD